VAVVDAQVHLEPIGGNLMITPIFKLNKGEKFRPQPVETAAQFGTIDGQPIDLDALPNKGGRMDFPDPPKLKDPTSTAVVGYHRAVREANLYWHQYWLWYLYNPWSFAGTGVGRHEGDWEFVQLGCTDSKGDKPVLMTASQHRSGQKREFWRCELERGRPVVYVALGSHANFFTPGDRVDDVADGKGKKLTNIQWRDFGPWFDWKGRWGNSTGAGRSPESPGCQGERWYSPQLYHAGAAG
jgi:hypothetical protein